MKNFRLIRTVDPTGLSGVGPVAEGVVFSDGTVAVRWLQGGVSLENRAKGVKPTTVIHDVLKSVMALHGHGGATVIEFDGEAQPEPR